MIKRPRWSRAESIREILDKTAAMRDPGEPLKNIRISAYGGGTVELLEVHKMKSI